ncbi:hypothetical protein PC114_g9953 [Phytophthora cactorum]|nr:hypothetical protein PC114_g9953 [Phytophthora cactorum]
MKSKSRWAEWLPDAWPAGIEFIKEQRIGRGLKFCGVSCGGRREFKCVFCGVCANALVVSSAQAITRNVRTGMHGLVAFYSIPVGEVIRQNLGDVEFFLLPSKNAHPNRELLNAHHDPYKKE